MSGSIRDPSRRRCIALLASGAACAASAGCTFGSGPDHDGLRAPRYQPFAATDLPDTPLALVLSSGGLRGFVHVGVLVGLEELGIRPDLVVGASVGAMIGTLYCAGLDAARLRSLTLQVNFYQLASLAIGAAETFSGSPLADWVNELVAERLLQELRPRCVVVAATEAGTLMAFTAGDAGIAVQASAAVAGRFTPVTVRGRRYVDPDRVAPMPVRLTRNLGASRIISVDASAHEDAAPQEALRYRDGDLRKRRLTQPDAVAADVNLHPDFGYWVNRSTEFRERAIRAGYQATLAARDELLALNA